MAFTDTVLESARKIALDVVKKYSPTFQWATVISVDPLHVTYDGRTDPLTVTPSTLVGGLVVGDRVYVVTYMRRAVIVGRAGGQATPAIFRVDSTEITVPGGGSNYIARTISYPDRGAIPAVYPGYVAGPDFKGYISVQRIAADSCVIRVWNAGDYDWTGTASVLLFY